MEIISSIYIYNFHIIISYLGSGIKIIPFNDRRKRFFHKYDEPEYVNAIDEKLSLNELNAKGDILFGTSVSIIHNYNLLNYNKGVEKKIILPNILFNQLSIDYSFHNLYALSEKKGIYTIDIDVPISPIIKNPYIPKLFDNLGDPVVSSMVSEKNKILLAIRGYGVSSLFNQKDYIHEETEYRSDDPQDVDYDSKNNIVVIADSVKGIEIYDHNKRIINAVKLPNNDFPQQVKFFYNQVLIKGKYGLYIYNYLKNTIKNIFEGRVGTLYTYYEYIFFTSRGTLHLLMPDISNNIFGFKLKDTSMLALDSSSYKIF
jgi:hypothetical protein